MSNDFFSHPVVTAVRAVFADRCVLFGKSVKGQELIGVPCKPKSIYKWMRSGQPKADLARVQKAYDRVHGDKCPFCLAPVVRDRDALNRIKPAVSSTVSCGFCEPTSQKPQEAAAAAL